MAECRKYLRDEKEGRHAFIAVVPIVRGFHIYVWTARLSDQYAYGSSSPSGFYHTLGEALRDVDGITEEFLNSGFSIAWEAMDSNHTAVPWFEIKMRKFRDIVEPEWFVAAPTIAKQQPVIPVPDIESPMERGIRAAEALGLPAVHFPSNEKSNRAQAPVDPSLSDVHRSRRRKAPWNF